MKSVFGKRKKKRTANRLIILCKECGWIIDVPAELENEKLLPDHTCDICGSGFLSKYLILSDACYQVVNNSTGYLVPIDKKEIEVLLENRNTYLDKADLFNFLI